MGAGCDAIVRARLKCVQCAGQALGSVITLASNMPQALRPHLDLLLAHAIQASHSMGADNPFSLINTQILSGSDVDETMRTQAGELLVTLAGRLNYICLHPPTRCVELKPVMIRKHATYVQQSVTTGEIRSNKC